MFPIVKEYNLLLLIKVRLEDVFYVPNHVYYRERYRGRIKSRHVDFVVCDKKITPLAGIELDDLSHYNENQGEVDAFKNKLFSEANTPLFRFKAQDHYDESSMRGAIKSLTVEEN